MNESWMSKTVWQQRSPWSRGQYIAALVGFGVALTLAFLI